MDKEKFRKTVELLRANHPDCDIILNMTTSGDIHADDTTRQIHLKELRPEMGSYDCGSMNWLHTSLFLNPPAFLEELGKNMQEWGVKPEIEAFDPGHDCQRRLLLKKGRAEGPPSLPVLHGLRQRHPRLPEEPDLYERDDGIPVPRLHLELLRGGPFRNGDAVRRCGAGRPHRVGMEDNVMYAKGVLAESNVQFVERARRVIEEYGKQVATPAEAREILSLGK